MGGGRKPKASKILSGVFGGSGPPDSLSRGQSSSDPLSEQSSGEQRPQQAALSLPATGRVFSMFKSRPRYSSKSPSWPLGVEGNITNQPLISQSLIVLASVPPQPHTQHLETSAQQTRGPSVCDLPPLTVGGSVTAMSSSNHGSPSYSNNQGSSISPPVIRISHSQSEPLTSDIPVPASTCAPQSPDGVWTEIAKKKLSNNNLPSLDLISQLVVKENMQPIVHALDSLKENNMKKRWSYTWGGKNVIVVGQLGKILALVTRYSKAVDIAIQANPQLCMLIWGCVWAIMKKVCINSLLYIAHAACEKKYAENILIPRVGHFGKCKSK